MGEKPEGGMPLQDNNTEASHIRKTEADITRSGPLGLLLQKVKWTPEGLKEMSLEVESKHPLARESQELRKEFRQLLNQVHDNLRKLQEPLTTTVFRNKNFNESDRKAAVEIMSEVRDFAVLLQEIDDVANWGKIPPSAIAWFRDRLIGNGSLFPLRSEVESILNNSSSIREGSIGTLQSKIYRLLCNGDDFENLARFYAYLKVQNKFSVDPDFCEFIPSAILHARVSLATKKDTVSTNQEMKE